MSDVKEEEVVNRITKMAAQRHFSGDLSSISIQAIQSKNLLIRMKFTPETKNWNGYFSRFWALAENSYIFMIAGLEPKLFILKSSTQQQSYRAHTIGQFCHQDRPSICLCSKVRDRVITAFQLAPKWSKVAVGGFCKFGPFPPHLTPQTARLEHYDVHCKSFSWISHLRNFCSFGLVVDHFGASWKAVIARSLTFEPRQIEGWSW